MTRKKVKLAYISNDSSRKATFKKRKKGLMKKVKELSTLCRINACAIIYSPYDATPDVWPSPAGVQRVVSEFRMLSEMDQSKKMVNMESFIRQRISKATDLLMRQRKDNREKEMTEVMFQCLIRNMGMFHLNLMDLNDLGFLIDQYGKDVNRRIEILKKSSANSELVISESSAAASVSAADTMTVTSAVNFPAPTDVGPSSSSVPLNPLQQYLNPTAGMYGQPLMGADPTVQRHQHQWYMELMNHPEQMGFVAEEIGFPFMDESHNHNNAAAVTAAASSTVSNTATSAAGPTGTGNLWSGEFFL